MTLNRRPAKPTKYKSGNIISITYNFYEIIQKNNGEVTTYDLKFIMCGNTFIESNHTYIFSQAFVEKNSELVANDLDSFKAQLL